MRSVVLCPEVVKRSSEEGGEFYRISLLAKFVDPGGVKMAIDLSEVILDQYKQEIDRNLTWSDLMDFFEKEFSKYFETVNCGKRKKKISSVVAAVARNKNNGNEIVAWDKHSYRDDDLVVYDRDTARDLFYVSEVDMKDNASISIGSVGNGAVVNIGDSNAISSNSPYSRLELEDDIRILRDFVKENDGNEAKESLSTFISELKKEEPDRKMLSVAWEMIRSNLPDAQIIATIGEKVSKILS
jgi:hypothetical protein